MIKTNNSKMTVSKLTNKTNGSSRMNISEFDNLTAGMMNKDNTSSFRSSTHK